MTTEAAPLTHQKPSKKHKHKKKKPTKQSSSPTSLNSIKALNSLQWNPSLPIDTEDPFGNDTEGGFLSLEEIDASEYDLAFPQSNKRSRSVIDADTAGSDGGGSEAVGEEKVKKKKKKRSKKKKKSDETISDEQEINNVDEVIEDKLIEDEEYKAQFYAWNELRLHPLIMKAIYALGFKDPTPVQKACIPAAAHRGKDVIGASETGSGKTLAFGIPILQRLLEEQEKAKNSLSEEEEGSKVERGAQGSPLRALIVTPTRELALQVSDHLKKVARFTGIRVVSIVGKMYKEKQERLLKYMPEVIVGTPGRLWDLMSGGDHHLSELHSLSFFVLDEADRMVESGHFHELQSIIDMLPTSDGSVEAHRQDCVTVSNIQKKKRQTLMFSATIALSTDFRKKLKRGSHEMRKPMDDGRTDSLETLSQRAGMRADAAIVDLTNTSIVANKLEESFVECREEDKDAYLYYLLSVHGQRRTIVFCTSIAALRHISSLLRILGINVWTLHSQMQQRARLKSIDHFRGNEHAVLVATDVAARGLDIPGVRTVIHYQLPHSADVYVHRSGRTARASAEGCCIALISPNDGSKFASLCKSFSKESYQRFPLDNSYMPEIIKRVSLARQIDKILRKESQEKATKTWFKRNAEPMEMIMEDNDSEEDIVNRHKQKKRSSLHLKHLQQELNLLLSRPLEPQAFSHRFLAGSGVSPLVQGQFEEIAKQKAGKNSFKENNKRKFVVIGQDCIDPLEALQNAQNELNYQGHVDVKEKADKQRNAENLRRKRKQEKKGLRENRKKQRKQRNRLGKSGE